MYKYVNNKLLLLFSMVVILMWNGCVDTGVENIAPKDYTSLVKFVNQVPGADATIAVDNSQVSTVPAGQESGYVEVPSGSRNVMATYSAGANVTETVFLETEFRITVTIVEDSTGRHFVKSLEGLK